MNLTILGSAKGVCAQRAGGGILAVAPGKGAIVGFAPPLDQAGNTVKPQKSIAYVADELDINICSPGWVGLK